jgi:hypothetical protein
MITNIRRLHLYLGLFFAPSILFFAFTGALQTLGLHESRKGQSYVPPAWIATLAHVHKDQRLGDLAREPVVPADAGQPRAGEHPAGPHRLALLKWFVLVMSLGLSISTALGIYMSFAYNRHRIVLWSLLVSGVLLPLLFLLV